MLLDGLQREGGKHTYLSPHPNGIVGIHEHRLQSMDSRHTVKDTRCRCNKFVYTRQEYLCCVDVVLYIQQYALPCAGYRTPPRTGSIFNVRILHSKKSTSAEQGCHWKGLVDSGPKPCRMALVLSLLRSSGALKVGLGGCDSPYYYENWLAFNRSRPERSARVPPRFTTAIFLPASAALFTRRNAE